jgi:hypothetical protein
MLGLLVISNKKYCHPSNYGLFLRISINICVLHVYIVYLLHEKERGRFV